MYTCLRSNILEPDCAREARCLHRWINAGGTRIHYGCEDQAEGKNESRLAHYGKYPTESQRIGGAVPWYSQMIYPLDWLRTLGCEVQGCNRRANDCECFANSGFKGSTSTKSLGRTQWHWDCPNYGRRQDFASCFVYNRKVLAIGSSLRAASV